MPTWAEWWAASCVRCSRCHSAMFWDGVICARCAIDIAERGKMKPDSKTDGYRRMLRKIADVVPA